MSATGRKRASGEAYERDKDDFFATPAWCTEAILRVLNPWFGARLLDPCCGDGAILNVAEDWDLEPHGIELDHGRAAIASARHEHVTQGDAIDLVWRDFDLIVTNPPYACALDFVQAALNVAQGRPVAMLLRLGFLESAKRVEFHKANPCDVYVLPRRPSFTGKGHDSTAYMWAIWANGRGGRWSILDVDGGG